MLYANVQNRMNVKSVVLLKACCHMISELQGNRGEREVGGVHAVSVSLHALGAVSKIAESSSSDRGSKTVLQKPMARSLF